MSANDLTNSTKEKDQNDNDLCKKHTSRCDKDYYRSICPSKLSKRELEDLYYSLLENNLELKRTINAQNEKNRMLSTKVQRMTAQTKTYMRKDCCAAGKAVINEQKAALADLTKANEALAERVRRLSTQLCTAKQFLKQSPNARHCYKCYANTTTSVKNLSTTSLQNKSSNVNLKSAAASAIHLDREHPSTRTAETDTVGNDVDDENDEQGDTEKACSENRCIAAMEQFKQKIGELEEELLKTHTEYTARMTQLETQVSQLQSAALREHGHSLEGARRGQRQADFDKAELEAQLYSERKRVAELEMRLKAAELSQEVAQTVEEHLSTAVRLEEKQLRQTSVERCNYCSYSIKAHVSPQPVQTMTPTKTLNQLTVPDDKVSKSDDSGYAEHRQESDIDDKNTNKTNQELMKMIENMQAQLDALKLITAEKGNSELEASPCPKTFDQYYTKSDEDQEIKNGEEILPKLTTETSAREPMHVSERRKSGVCNKLHPMNETDTPSKDFEDPSKEKYERDDSGALCECPNDNGENLENSGSCKSNECEEHSEICANSNVNKQDSLNASSSKETGDHEDAYSISLQAVGSMNTKPNLNDVDNVSVNSSTPTKNKRVSLFLFENGTDNRESAEIEPKVIQTLSPPPEPSKMKADDHNFHQIPGPLPVNSEVTGKRRVSRSDKIFEYYENGTVIDGHNKIDKVISKEAYLDKHIKNYQKEKKNVETVHGIALKKFNERGVDDNRKNKGLVIEVQYPEGYKKDNDSIRPNRSYEKHGETCTPVSVRPNIIADYKGAKDTFKTGDNEAEKLRNGNSAEINGMKRIKEFDICQHHATICLCPEKPSVSLALFRSCSGSQTLASLPVGGRFRRCSCSERAARYSCGSTLKDKPIGSSTPKADRAPPTSPHTYTIDSGKSRADSPANTDNEISVMTDLPSEKDDTYDRLSPGEHRPTQTSTETCSLRHDYAFSEGEVPRMKLYYQDRRESKSLGEVRRTDYEKELSSYGEQKSAAEKMESTLLAISQELARCRSLLLSQRPTEVKHEHN